jgi:hypothetical protein
MGSKTPPTVLALFIAVFLVLSSTAGAQSTETVVFPQQDEVPLANAQVGTIVGTKQPDGSLCVPVAVARAFP